MHSTLVEARDNHIFCSLSHCTIQVQLQHQQNQAEAAGHGIYLLPWSCCVAPAPAAFEFLRGRRLKPFTQLPACLVVGSFLASIAAIVASYCTFVLRTYLPFHQVRPSIFFCLSISNFWLVAAPKSAVLTSELEHTSNGLDSCPLHSNFSYNHKLPLPLSFDLHIYKKKARAIRCAPFTHAGDQVPWHE
ncbi:uncharacterized protein LY89DRAFT_216818 [Mollisia scopiformis]|uniref:Uncharacterized protein n=1 Tax=Mollisia scopiformis TaxID=149040 RepID=A0A194WVF5_MOLSC|nr:uncharacterized protein LY89DRAFT_216818 [Mollisia scopiformis]KUJ11948.1 hypothetical protein LY89DRAFT_216818 [Mollisia scopiformis]